MATALELITRASRMVNYIGQGQTLTGQEGADGLDCLNELIRSWNNQHLALYTSIRFTGTLAASTQTYTIGSGATFNTPRPDKISAAGWQDSDGLEYPITVLDTFEQWGNIPVKSTESTRPICVYLEHAYANAIVHVYPVPSETLTLVLYLEGRLTTLAALTTEVSLPDGYDRALKLNLAVELAAEFGVPASGEIRALAAESLGWLKSKNIQPRPIRSDPAAMPPNHGGRYYGRWLGGYE